MGHRSLVEILQTTHCRCIMEKNCDTLGKDVWPGTIICQADFQDGQTLGLHASEEGYIKGSLKKQEQVCGFFHLRPLQGFIGKG